ncbi:hypothetical protein pv_298 [Pithovirus sibericum]|uniref:Uncharacterized protein n=1 Tax=Pithovirus sibericum TaxID=1450746 RepID=W5SAQ8_9VIRU|nr:hypothetical protein pv_298 [Pithovirus sibericum]AHH01865.1 hypothetical protein pv_298 [Pithovirus sibericum]
MQSINVIECLDKVFQNEISESEATEKYGQVLYQRCLFSLKVADHYVQFAEKYDDEPQEGQICFASFMLGEVGDPNIFLLGNADPERIRDVLVRAWREEFSVKIAKTLDFQKDVLLSRTDIKDILEERIQLLNSVLTEEPQTPSPTSNSGELYISEDRSSASVYLYAGMYSETFDTHAFTISLEELRILLARLTLCCVEVTTI